MHYGLDMGSEALRGPKKSGFFRPPRFGPYSGVGTFEKGRFADARYGVPGDENLTTFPTAPLSAAAWSVALYTKQTQLFISNFAVLAALHVQCNRPGSALAPLSQSW